jgi:hypothetical protein
MAANATHCVVFSDRSGQASGPWPQVATARFANAKREPNHGQKRELGGVTITRGDLTPPGPLQKAVYSLTRRSQQVMRLRRGYARAACFYAMLTVIQKTELTGIVGQVHSLKRGRL